MQSEYQGRQNSIVPQSLIIEENHFSTQIKLTHIQNDHYFMLVNKKHQKALSFPSNARYLEANAQLTPVDPRNINQIFQIQEILPERFQIVHSMSTLVLSAAQQQCRLSFGKWKAYQFFFPTKLSSKENLEYWIKCSSSPKQKKHLVFTEGKLRCLSLPEPQMCADAVWQIRLCSSNKQLNRTCWFQYAFSNKVIDIPEASDRADVSLIQYGCNYRFNQRFHIYCEDPKTLHYKIQSLKSMQYMTVQESTFSTYVVQMPQNNKDNQLWQIQYLGNGLYTIKPAFKKNLYLVIKDRSYKECEAVILNDRKDWCLWKIVGNYNLMPNKDNRF